MNAKELFNTVKAMREAQREYFRTRSREALMKSKNLEKKIDNEIQRVENYINQQPTLFYNTMDLIKRIIAHILGNKYYANIINTRGTNRCEISCFIFCTKEEAIKHKLSLDANRSFMFVETVCFRSRKQY